MPVSQSDPQSLALVDSLSRLWPEMILAGAACVLFLGGTRRSDRNLWHGVTLAAIVAALIALFFTMSMLPVPAEVARAGTFANPLQFDNLSSFVRLLALGAGILLVLMSWREVGDKQAADHQGMLLVVLAGLSLSACANDLITLFLALEMISIPTYVMLYLPTHDPASQEAALKYFLLSVFSSALTLFGFSYLYGLTGTTNINALVAALSQAGADVPLLAHIALVMSVAGLAFKITAAPFHFYAPDVYQGAPTIGAAILTFLPKVAGFVALVRVLGYVVPAEVAAHGNHLGVALSDQAPVLFWFLAGLSMTLGNLFALLQDNLKRLLAYSSVAHTGYMLMVLASAPFLTRGQGYGVEALFYYLAAYGSMTLGAFGVISYLSTPERPVETVDDLAGLSKSHPRVSLAMALFLFSLIGVPLTAGFTAKLFVFYGALSVGDSHQPWLIGLTALAAINAAIGGWYYLRMIAAMYLRESPRPLAGKGSLAGGVMLALCVILTIGLSIPPRQNWLAPPGRENELAATKEGERVREARSR